MRKILFIGESWGKNEAAHSHAFVGATGVQLARLCHQAGILPPPDTWCHTCKAVVPYQAERECRICGSRIYPKPEDMIFHWQRATRFGVYLANVFNHQPPDNDIEWFFDRDGRRDIAPLKPGKYIRPEWMGDLIRLWDLIRSNPPNLLVPLGAAATWAVTGQPTKITEVRGGLLRSKPELGALKTIPSYHPSYILRQWPDRVTSLYDLKKIKVEAEFPALRRTMRWVTIAPTLAEIGAWLRLPAPYYAIDVETAYAFFTKAEISAMRRVDKGTGRNRVARLSSLLSMVGFARSPYDALVVELIQRPPGTDEIHPFFEAKADEVEAWRLVRFGLQRPIRKIFQNGNYDIQRFLELGLVPNQCEDDTMLRQHASFPEMEKSLGYLASIKLHEIPWKMMYSDRDHMKRDE